MNSFMLGSRHKADADLPSLRIMPLFFDSAARGVQTSENHDRNNSPFDAVEVGRLWCKNARNADGFLKGGVVA